MTHVIYKNCSTIQNKHVGQYPEGIGVFKFENFHLLETLFSLFCLFHCLQFKKFIFHMWNLLKISTQPF